MGELELCKEPFRKVVRGNCQVVLAEPQVSGTGEEPICLFRKTFLNCGIYASLLLIYLCGSWKLEV